MLEDKKSDYIIFFLAIAIIILIVISITVKKEPEVAEDYQEESLGSGFLEIETFPGNADIFVDDEYKGKSPNTVYDIPIGQHKILLKKEGYDALQMHVEIQAGKKSFVGADLVQTQEIGEREDIAKEEKDEIQDKIVEEPQKGILKTGNTIGIENKIILYYDFSEKRFAENRQPESDVFSKRFDTYLVFTRYNPATIKFADKSVDEVKKEDCIEVNGQFEYLHSGKSLCITTKEGKTIALGGHWESTKNAELIWKELD